MACSCASTCCARASARRTTAARVRATITGVQPEAYGVVPHVDAQSAARTIIAGLYPCSTHQPVFYRKHVSPEETYVARRASDIYQQLSTPPCFLNAD